MIFFTILSVLCICTILIISAIQRYKRYILSKKCLSHQTAVERLGNWYDGVDIFSTLNIDIIAVENKVDNTLSGVSHLRIK